jgi:hypothetical protein
MFLLGLPKHGGWRPPSLCRRSRRLCLAYRLASYPARGDLWWVHWSEFWVAFCTGSFVVYPGALRLGTHSLIATLIFPFYSVGLVITSSVGGAAGQLLRSNYRWSGP